MKAFDDTCNRKISIFMDESISGNFLSVGGLFIADNMLPILQRALSDVRLKNSCLSHLNYKDLSGHITSGKIQSAVGWLKALLQPNTCDFFFEFLRTDFTASVLQEHYRYNYSLKICLKSLLNKKVKGQRVIARIILHQRGEPSATKLDPYDKKKYLEKYLKEAKVNFEELSVLEGSSHPENSSLNPVDCEMLQLTDILVSGTCNALDGDSSKENKQQISMLLASVITETARYQPSDSAYRKFSFSCSTHGGNFSKISRTKVPGIVLDTPRKNKRLKDFFDEL